MGVFTLTPSGPYTVGDTVHVEYVEAGGVPSELYISDETGGSHALFTPVVIDGDTLTADVLLAGPPSALWNFAVASDLFPEGSYSDPFTVNAVPQPPVLPDIDGVTTPDQDSVISVYRGTGIVGTDGQTFSSWPDSGNFDHDAAQATSARRPTYRQNAHEGLPGADFDSTAVNYMTVDIDPAEAITGATLIAVIVPGTYSGVTGDRYVAIAGPGAAVKNLNADTKYNGTFRAFSQHFQGDGKSVEINGLFPKPEAAIIVARSGGGLTELLDINGIKATSTTAAIGTTLAGVDIGSYRADAATYAFDGVILDLVSLNVAASDAQVLLWQRYMMAANSVTVPNTLIFVGESITAGANCTEPNGLGGGAFPSQVVDLLGGLADWNVANLGVSAYAFSNLAGEQQQMVNNWMTVLNDHSIVVLYPPFVNSRENAVSAADIKTATLTYAQGVQDAGGKFIICTIAQGASPANDARNAEIDDYNAWIIANAAEFDGIADIGAHPSMQGDAADRADNFGIDPWHPNDDGAGIMAPIVVDEIVALAPELGEASGGGAAAMLVLGIL